MNLGNYGMSQMQRKRLHWIPEKRPPLDTQIPPGSQEYFQGQYQHPMYPQWPIHPHGAPPIFQPYPMHSMPYYQNYPGIGPFFQPPYPPMDDPRQTLVSGICAKSGANVQSRRGIRSANVMYLKDLALGEAKNKNFVFSPMSVQLLPATGEDHDGFLSKWIQKVTNALMPSKGYLIWQMAQLNEHWSGQNVKMDIKDSQFYLLEGDSVEVPYVTSATTQLINTFEGLKVLRIPFRFKTLSMYILLPNNGDKLWSLIERVDSDPWFLKRCLCPNTDAVSMGSSWYQNSRSNMRWHLL